MLTPYERRLALSCLAHATARLSHRDKAAEELADWLADHCGPLQLDDLEAHLPARRNDLTAKSWQRLCQAVAAARRAGRARADRAARRLAGLAKAAHLSRTDVAILDLLLRCETRPLFDTLARAFDGIYSRRAPRYHNLASSVLPWLLGLSDTAFRNRFASDAPLVALGLVRIDDDGDIDLLNRLKRLVSEPESAGFDISRLLLGAPRAAELGWQDFDHIAEGRDHLERLLAGALEQGAKGVNILVHGPPGTGKTAFCATLAARLGVPLYGVGESDDDGDEPSRHERLHDLRSSQRLLAPGQGAILLFDEMEDLLSGRRRLPFPVRPGRGPARGRRFQAVHEPAAGRGADAGAVDLQRRPPDRARHPAPHDVRPGNAPPRPPPSAPASGRPS